MPTDTCAAQAILEEMAAIYKALADVNRLKIINFLATDSTGVLGVSDLANLLGITQPAVTQHLKVLKGVRLVESRKKGFRVQLRFNRERMLEYQVHADFLYRCIMDRCAKDMIPGIDSEPGGLSQRHGSGGDRGGIP
jgi:DNA-binding transcriptional ArsR family regulator